MVRENENAGHLDLLGVSCLSLARVAISPAPDSSERRKLAKDVRELADVLGELAREPGDRVTRQRAVNRSLEVARGLSGGAIPAAYSLAAVLIAIRAVALDTMVFAGVDPDVALAADYE